jgi:hypothetical protein
MAAKINPIEKIARPSAGLFSLAQRQSTIVDI